MKTLIALILAAGLSSCGTVRDGTNTHIMITCTEASGLGRFFAGNATNKKLTHSDLEYVFTDQDKKLLGQSCPQSMTQAQALGVLLREQSSAGS